MSEAHWRPAYIGVGSNLDNPLAQVQSGIRALAVIRDTDVTLTSPFYQSKPLCGTDQPDYINAVVALLTTLGVRDLFAALKLIEEQHGRDRSAERWGPRTLDLDLLAFSGLILSDADLSVPHPGVAERNFVLLPWREIAPHYRVPGLSTVAELAASVGNQPAIDRIS